LLDVQVNVDTVDPPVVKTVGLQSSVTWRAVFVVEHDEEEEEEDESLFEDDDDELVFEDSDLLSVVDFLSVLVLSLSSVKSSVSPFKSVIEVSIPSTSFVFTLTLMLSKSFVIHAKELTTSPIRLANPLFRRLAEPHPLFEESVPRSEMRFSTEFFRSSTLFNVSVFKGVGFAFQDERTGMRPII
jgi:hypothetical protein